MSTAVREHPMPFNIPMVQAVLDGRKTQTRRPVTSRNSELGSARWEWIDLDAAWPDLLWGVTPGLKVPTSKAPPEYCPECVTRLYPRIAPGDRLWVREAWRPKGSEEDGSICIEYTGGAAQWIHGPADPQERDRFDEWSFRVVDSVLKEVGRRGVEIPEDVEVISVGTDTPLRWRPSIHMPRWASRILLEVTEVRPERVQEITLSDVLAEGSPPSLPWRDVDGPGPGDWFQRGWDSIYAKRGYGWDANPWVWVVSFRRLGP